MAINYDDAILAHTRWKKRLNDLIEKKSDEKLDPEKVGRDDQCDLGKWIQTVRGQFRDDSDFAQLVAKHADFHKQAAKIIVLIQGGNRSGARQAIEIGGDYSKVSAVVVDLIKTIREKTKK